MANLNLSYYSGRDQYSDGDIEDTILRLVRAGKNPGDDGDRAFPVLYHLSPVRENILSWYPFREGASALEIGAGPGAITGVLCRRLARVTSVDLSKRRSLINYERHKDYPNLEIMVGNLNDMEFPEKFDYVILNGVFEYAGSYTEGDHPWETFLMRCRGYLKDDGLLLIAIENRLGLKYFCGAPEDHTDNYMEGLKNYPDNKAVRTFSKAEWLRMMENCGLSWHRFYYPSPDYKFANEIFTDSTLTARNFCRNNWNFNPGRLDLFPENEMARSLCEEGIMDRFSNSFLIEAGTEEPAENGKLLYVKINSDRAESFRIQTLACVRDGKKMAVKSPLTKKARAHLEKMHERELAAGRRTGKEAAGPDQKGAAENRAGREPVFCLDGKQYRVRLLKGEKNGDGSLSYPWLNGRNLGQEAADAADRGDAARVKELFDALYRCLLETADPEEKKAEENPAFREVFGSASSSCSRPCAENADIDLILDNLFLEEDGTAYVIDAEWVFDFPVPVQFILWRAVNELYSMHPSLDSFLPEAELLGGYSIREEDRKVFWNWADHFEKEYVGANSLEAFSWPVRGVNLRDLKNPVDDLTPMATLYLDYGNGFSEEEAVHRTMLLKDGAFRVEFPVKDPEKVKAVRFDPVEGSPCICTLRSEQAQVRPLNASGPEQEGCCFLTMDPAYELLFRGQVPEIIRLSGVLERKTPVWAMERGRELLDASEPLAKKAVRKLRSKLR